jgi:HD-GYP domain-containing protein (c-di-GMP phosphodiesterase class II)
MQKHVRSLFRRPPGGALIGGALMLVGAWMIALASAAGPAPGLMLVLIGAIIAADQYPIHVQHHTKITLVSAPLYLCAALLPAYLAAITAGVGIAVAELLGRQERDSLPIDVIVATSRLAGLALLGSWVAHALAMEGAPHILALLGTAILMSVGDLLTGSLHTASISGESAFQVFLATAREIYLAEASQYLLGMLGALAAEVYPWSVVLLVVPSAIIYLAFKAIKELGDSTRQLLESMADAVDLRDPYTGGHSRRVAEYCANILRQLDLRGPEVDLILAAARVHDIGKIGIPDQILNKPDRLTDEERAIMETHAARGAELLVRYPDFARGAEIVRHHHESLDGSGYPSKLAGYAIPFGARVIAVADSYDAMTSDRPYRRGMQPAKAAQILHEGCGKQWDPAIVEAFLRSITDQVGPLPATAAPIAPVALADGAKLKVAKC